MTHNICNSNENPIVDMVYEMANKFEAKKDARSKFLAIEIRAYAEMLSNIHTLERRLKNENFQVD